MQHSTQWDGRSKGSVLGTLIFLKIISTIGLFPAYCLLTLGSCYYVFKDKKSVRALRDFRTRLGLPTSFFYLWRHFFSFGMNILDRYAFLSRKKTPFIIKTIHEATIIEALKNGKGALLLSAHIGNWEMAGNLLHDRIGVPISYAMVDAEKPEVRKAFAGALARRRISVIPINQDGMGLMLRIRAALRGNEIVCMHGDRMFGKKAESARFFNSRVKFPLGPFAIAQATGAPIIPIFAVKKGLRTYEIRAFDPILLSAEIGNKKDAHSINALEKYVRALETVVKENPYEWFNFYDFWGEAT